MQCQIIANCREVLNKKYLQLFYKEVFYKLPTGLAANISNGFRQGYIFWAYLNANLRIATIGDSAFTHYRIESFLFIHAPRWMQIEKPDLIESCSSHERIVQAELRAGL